MRFVARARTLFAEGRTPSAILALSIKLSWRIYNTKYTVEKVQHRFFEGYVLRGRHNSHRLAIQPLALRKRDIPEWRQHCSRLNRILHRSRATREEPVRHERDLISWLRINFHSQLVTV